MNPRLHRISDQRRLFAWTALACTLLLGALAAPFFAKRVYTRDDLGAFHLPIRNFYAEQLARGEAFDWMPDLFCGFYLTGEGQTGGYHPLHYVLYRTLPLGAAFNLELLLSYPLMLGGMYAFLRRLIRRRDAALYGSLVFTFSGFCLLHFVHPNAIAVVAHIPWLLWAIDVRLTGCEPHRVAWADAAIALLTASQLLLGYPQYVWFSLLAETSFVAWYVYPAVRRTRTVSWAIAEIAVAKVLGAVIAAIQLFPTIDALHHSTRNAVDVTFANSGSLHPLNAIQFVAPYLFQARAVGQNTHELGLYMGAVPCLLVIWLMTHSDTWKRNRRLIYGVVAFAAMVFVLALGEYGFLYRVQSYLPLVSRFRFPCRAIVLVHLAIAVLAAIAFAHLASNKFRTSGGAWHAARPLWLCVIASGLIAAAAPLLWSEHVADIRWIAIGPVLFTVAAILLWQAQCGQKWAITGLVLLTAVDLGAYGMSYSAWSQTADLKQFVAAGPRPPVNGLGRVAASVDQRQMGNRILLSGFSRADGYAGLSPSKSLDYHQVETLRLAGVGWVLRSERREGISGVASGEWQKVDAPARRARLIEVDAAVGSRATGANSELHSKPLNVVSDRPGKIVIESTSAASRVLALTESYHDGWQVTVDGQPTPVVPVEHDFLGCVVPAGGHRVEFVFRPFSLKFGEWVSACGLGLLVGLVAIRGRTRLCLPKESL